MIHFIRNKRNESLVDVEVFTNENDEVDLSVTILIKPYSEFLTENLQDDLQIIKDFDSIQQMKNWLWDVYKPANPNVTKEEVSDRVRHILSQAADAYEGLFYVED